MELKSVNWYVDRITTDAVRIRNKGFIIHEYEVPTEIASEVRNKLQEKMIDNGPLLGFNYIYFLVDVDGQLLPRMAVDLKINDIPFKKYVLKFFEK